MGKNLNLRSIETSITNEIHVYETIGKNSTYRTTTYRTPERAKCFPIEAKSKEVLQSGDIPPPMYGSTLTMIEYSNTKSGEAILLGGNSLNERPSPIQVMLGMKDVWQEKSNGCIYLLKFDLDNEEFLWEKKDLEIEPRAHLPVWFLMVNSSSLEVSMSTPIQDIIYHQ